LIRDLFVSIHFKWSNIPLTISPPPRFQISLSSLATSTFPNDSTCTVLPKIVFQARSEAVCAILLGEKEPDASPCLKAWLLNKPSNGLSGVEVGVRFNNVSQLVSPSYGAISFLFLPPILAEVEFEVQSEVSNTSVDADVCVCVGGKDERLRFNEFRAVV
jgi:hypothetical protein